ncbi:MAG TPA: hypothetical protein VHG51_04685 [Longimicrobiaceae bacterium]|nr:hypothetical protein [Longimicrobiaceae bacterium]
MRAHARDFHRELREQAARGVRGLTTFARAKAGSALHRLARRGAAGGPAPTAAPAPQPDASRRAPRLRHMRRAVGSYLPGRYGGRVTLIWGGEAPPPGWDPTAGWGRVAREVEIVHVPGDHDTCVSVHLEELAEKVSGLLRRADGPG